MKIDAVLLIQLDETRRKSSRLAGELADRWYASAIGISQFDFGGSDETNETELAGGKADTASTFGKIGFGVTKELDRASPALFNAYCVTYAKDKKEGINYFPRVDVIFRKVGTGDPQEYTVFEFEGVLLTSYSLQIGDDGAGKESVKFRFETCKMRYRMQEADGRLAASPEIKGWNYKTNTVA